MTRLDSADEKRRFMKSVASMLIENRYAWEYGFWEFSADADHAIKSFNQWRNEIEASMATETEEMGSEIDRLHRFSDQKEYLIVTLLMLIDNSDEPVSDDVGDYRFRPTYSQRRASLPPVVRRLRRVGVLSPRYLREPARRDPRPRPARDRTRRNLRQSRNRARRDFILRPVE